MTDNSSTEQLLLKLQTKLGDVRGALLATLDGIAIANAQVHKEPNQLAAMTAASLGLGQRMIETINGQGLSEISVTGNKGSVFVYSVGTKAALIVVTKESPNIALVNWEARKLIEELAELGYR